MAVAATMRNYGNDKVFFQEMLPYFDHEVLTSLPRLQDLLSSPDPKESEEIQKEAREDDQ